MRVIQEGPSEFHHEFTCPSCKSRLEVTAEDVIAGEFFNLGESDYGYYVECPLCEEAYRFDSSIIPLLVRRNADRKRGFYE